MKNKKIEHKAAGKIKLLSIRHLSDRVITPYATKHWVLTQRWHFQLVTNEGVLDTQLTPGWITDQRSGSDAINAFVPKEGNRDYNAIVGFHDASWSGWLTRELSDELLRQGMILSGEVSPFMARIAKFAVDHFGKYYELDEVLPKPYQYNRYHEQIKWMPK